MRGILSKAGKLLHPTGRKAAVWQVGYRLRAPLLRLTRLHRATLSRWSGVVMVAGTYGKTTTTRAVRAALGLPVDAWAQANANAGGLLLWPLLRDVPWRRYSALEVGIVSPGQMREYADSLQPTLVVVTCVGSEHIQSFENLEHLRAEKAEAVRSLPPHATAILNGDDPNVAWMTTQTQAHVLRFGFDPAYDVSARDVALDWPHGTCFTLRALGQERPMRVRLIGRHMLYPILAAVAVGLAAGRDLARIVEALEALPPTQGRVHPVLLPNGAIVLRDDYKSTIDTVHTALDLLAELPAERRIVVMGSLDSPPDPQKAAYRAVGEHIASVADRVLIVGDEFDKYRRGLRSGNLPESAIRAVRTIHEAIAVLREELCPDDLVLVKGRTVQRMTRIILALSGRTVRCALDACRLHLQFCDDCPLLEQEQP
jgi:UDP-N-acetylmuramyl pentapeptide synthase